MMTNTVMPCSVAVFTIGLLLDFSRRVNLLEKASSSPMVKTATEQGITVVVIMGNSIPRAHERSG